MNKRSKSELCLQLTRENEDLKSKIERSRPILTTIYDKVKRKQKLLFDRINQKTKAATDFKTLASEYKKLYQQSVTMMQKSKTIDKFNYSLGNYILNKTMKHNRTEQDNKNSISVYEQYKQQMDRAGINAKQERNLEVQNLRRENEHLKHKMISQISRLKMARTKSLSTFKKNKGNIELKPPRSSQSESSEQYYKRKLAQRQKRKLADIPS